VTRLTVFTFKGSNQVTTSSTTEQLALETFEEKLGYEVHKVTFRKRFDLLGGPQWHHETTTFK
jgi:hypothetical protein